MTRSLVPAGTCAVFIQETKKDINIVLIITSLPVRDSGSGRSIYSGKICPMSTIRFWPSSKEEAPSRCMT